MSFKRKVKTYAGNNKSASDIHRGFEAVQNSIARKEGISKESAGAILASASRHASASAKRKNPRLKRVKG